MLEKLKLDSDDMVLAITLWLCTLPLIGLLVIPFFGVQVGLFVAVALFFCYDDRMLGHLFLETIQKMRF